MSGLLGFGSGSGAPTLNSSQSTQVKEQIKNSILTEFATAHASTLVNRLTESCFDKCITNPASSMSSVETACVQQCSEKFMRAWNSVSKTYINRIQSQGQ